jgi:hypothetical protein
VLDSISKQTPYKCELNGSKYTVNSHLELDGIYIKHWDQGKISVQDEMVWKTLDR